MSARTVSLVFGLAVAALISTTTLAFEQLDPPRRWFGEFPDRTLTVDQGGLVDVTGGGGATEAVGAVEAWDDIPADDTTSILDAVSGDASGIALGDSFSHLAFSDPLGVCVRTCLAVTFTGFFNEGSTALCDDTLVAEITDSDIFFNPTPGFGPFSFGWTSATEDPNPETDCDLEFYIEAVTTHELGHFIGLDHEDSRGVDALMNSGVAVCDNKTLTQDDVDGRDSLYVCTVFTICDGTSTCGFPKGQACTADNLCASGRCKGRSGAMTCK